MKVVGRRELVHVGLSVEGALAAVVSARAVVPDALRAACLTEKAPRVSPVGATRRRSYGDLQRQALPPRQPR